MTVQDYFKLFSFLLLSTPYLVAQTHFTFTANTGNNATVAITTATNPNIGGSPLQNGDEIGVFTPAGLCVGAVVWQGTNTAITVWGDNDQTPEIDGIRVGEQIHYRVWQKSSNTEFTQLSVTYSQGNGIYAVNGIYVLSSLTAVVGAQSHFTFTANTGNNATVAITTSTNPNIGGSPLQSGDEIGAFTPAGLCVGAVVWQGTNTAITVWGDNDQTPEVDGIRVGEEMHYRLWQKSRDTVFTKVIVAYSQGNGIYTVNGIYVLGSFRVLTTSLFVANPIPDTTLADGRRLYKRKLTTAPVVFGGNKGALTFTTMSSDTSYVVSSILAGDTLQVRGLINSQGTAVTVTVAARDTDSATLFTTFKVTVTGVSEVLPEQSVPTHFGLNQNYPNPFNPVTVIRYQLPVMSSIRLRVFNILGEQVAEVVNTEQDAGFHYIEWQPTNAASGVYFYRIEATASDNSGRWFAETKKMLIIR